MKLRKIGCLTILALCHLATPSTSQEILDCPNPLFACIGPGPGDDPPGTPPDPIFKPVQPLIKANIDFNKSFGVIQDGKMTVSSGTPALSAGLNRYLENHRLIIDPNAVYAISPNSVVDTNIGGEAIIVGGGALTQ